MPIYEYRCASCGHELEVLQRLADAPLSVCPACHKSELKKLVSAAGFQLKGSGWYVTDFRNSGAKPSAKEKPAGGETAPGGNGNAAATVAGDGSAGDAKKGETKATETKPSAAAAESKPGASATPGSKSDA